MCNRFRSIKDWSEIPRDLRGTKLFNFEFNPNVAPTELVPVITAQPDGPPATTLGRFGINMTGKDGKPRAPLLNARTDGLQRGQFRQHLQKQRCVIPAAGFYEWRDEDGKQPYYFSRKDGQPIMFAGIWAEAEYKGDKRTAFAILTDEPNDLIAPYHDRMPVALADGQIKGWLNLNNQNPLDADLLLPLDAFTVRSMNRAMNNVRQKDLATFDREAA